jgi:hypothetical protein
MISRRALFARDRRIEVVEARRSLIAALAHWHMRVAEIARLLDMDHSTITHHIAVARKDPYEWSFAAELARERGV